MGKAFRGARQRWLALATAFSAAATGAIPSAVRADAGIDAFLNGGEAAHAASGGAASTGSSGPLAMGVSGLPARDWSAASPATAAGDRGSPGWRDVAHDDARPQDPNRLLHTSARLDLGTSELVLSRQILDLSYPRPRDVRANRGDVTYIGRTNDRHMAALAYEAVLVAGRASEQLRYYAGYVAGAKPIAAPRFASMAELFGASGSGGMWLSGVQWSPAAGLWVQSFWHQVNGALSIGYLDADYVHRLPGDAYLRVAAQRSTQTSLQDEPGGRRYRTANAGAYGEIGWRGVSTYVALTATDANGALRRPLSAGPIYTAMAARDFVRAGENALLAGAAFDFARIADVRGLTLDVVLADGRGAVDPVTGAGLPDTREYDMTLAYAFGKGSPLTGARVQARFVRVEEGLTGGMDVLRINLALPAGFL
jgi:hypothetical protein